MGIAARSVGTIVVVLLLAQALAEANASVSAPQPRRGGMAFVGQHFRPLSRTVVKFSLIPGLWSKCRAELSALANQPKSRMLSNFPGIRLRGGNHGHGMTMSSSTCAAGPAAQVQEQQNPLLVETPFPRFDAVTAEHVVPGIRHLIQVSEQNLQNLEKDLDTLGNAITADQLMPRLEQLSDALGRAWSVCQHLKAVKDSEPFRKAVEEVQPEYVTFSLKMSQSRQIYKAFKAIRSSAAWDTISEAKKRIIEAEIRDAELSGVALEGQQKERFNVIQQELAQLATDFSNNVLDATKAFSVRLTKKEEVDGLPESALALAAQTARSKGDADATTENGPWVITLDMPAYMPVMQYAKDRSLREKMYKAYLTRASELGHSDGKNLDNTPLATKILLLKQEKAQLLGKKNHAEVSTSSKMATLESALDLMERLRDASYGPAQQELKDLETFAASQGFKGELMPWDATFYADEVSERDEGAEALREAQYAFNEEELRPYFSLPRVLKGLFALAKRLFDVDVVEAAGVAAPVWHPDVQFWQINRNGQPIAYFYLDPYSRPEEKRGGAWMDDVQGRSSVLAPPGVAVRLPVAHMVCNQSPPVGDKPSLMTFREVETLFHEFGHALQHMLTTQAEGLVAGIRGVEWDAVELPSQFMENWCYDKPTIDGMALHYQTGAPIPADLWAKVKAAKNFRAATAMLRQLQFAVTDLTLHSSFDPAAGAAGGETIHDVHRRIAGRYQVTQPMPYDRFLCGFSHIFAGGYSAGYYSYKWAEVLSADCFGAFEEAGLTDEEAVRGTGRRFRDTVLALGGGASPARVFEAFRGRPPSPEALLRHSGLLPQPA